MCGIYCSFCGFVTEPLESRKFAGTLEEGYIIICDHCYYFTENSRCIPEDFTLIA